MKELALKAVNAVIMAVWFTAIAPFILPAYAIVRLTGGDPFHLDAGGTASFVMMVAIAIGIAIATAAFGIGYFFF
jgi:ABC-type Na+ efflux pump permease subunit